MFGEKLNRISKAIAYLTLANALFAFYENVKYKITGIQAARKRRVNKVGFRPHD